MIHDKGKPGERNYEGGLDAQKFKESHYAQQRGRNGTSETIKDRFISPEPDQQTEIKIERRETV